MELFQLLARERVDPVEIGALFFQKVSRAQDRSFF